VKGEAYLRRAAEVVRQARLARGWSQEQLAFEAGASQGQICRLEAGTASPTFTTVARVLAALGVSITFDIEPRRPTT
jgi:transcriptional regulator with XRE-family HTH domain